jgi:hypothetical protein
MAKQKEKKQPLLKMETDIPEEAKSKPGSKYVVLPTSFGEALLNWLGEQPAKQTGDVLQDFRKNVVYVSKIVDDAVDKMFEDNKPKGQAAGPGPLPPLPLNRQQRRKMEKEKLKVMPGGNTDASREPGI